jgi:hypothetical protein
VLQVDDLVEPCPEQIVRTRRLGLLRPHRPSDATTKSRRPIRQNPQNEIARFHDLKPQNLAIRNQPLNENRISRQVISRSSRPTKYRKINTAAKICELFDDFIGSCHDFGIYHEAETLCCVQIDDKIEGVRNTDR